MRSSGIGSGYRAALTLAVIGAGYNSALAQAPVITSFVNAASYQPTLNKLGVLATIFGSNLAPGTAEAAGYPLPTHLGGTTVAVGGTAAPLLYVSPTQINFQVPSDGAIVVSTSAGSSAPYDPATATPNTWAAGGLFDVNGSGCGQGAVLNLTPYGGVSVNSPSNSAAPGDWISVYGTGLILTFPGGTYGVPVPAVSPPPRSASGGSVYFGFGGLTNEQKYLDYTWYGAAPDFVGIDQLNIQIPATVREGCAVPIRFNYLTTAEADTQPVTMAIHSERGQCVDPPQAGYGQILWEKSTSTTAAGVVSETDTLLASFESSPGKTVPPAPTYTDQCPSPSHVCSGPGTPFSYTFFGPSCPVPGYRSLDAGKATIQGPGLTQTPVPLLPYQDGQLGGLTAYQATLPAGTIQAGTFTFSAAGGADLGQFHAALPIGADIQIQTALAGVTVPDCTSLTIKWTGGDPNAWVTVRLVQQEPLSVGGGQSSFFGAQTRASAGALTLPLTIPGGIPCEPTTLVPFTSIVVEEDPDPSEVLTFSAPGLSLGGQATWKYVHTYEAGASN
jgi:uncharacterized protein (TIGR03437 family)